MFFALMAIDGKENFSKIKRISYYDYLGIFKNNQAQVDEYLTALNPLLRRTTEGKSNTKPSSRICSKNSSPSTVRRRTSSSSTNSESESMKSRMIIFTNKVLLTLKSRRHFFLQPEEASHKNRDYRPSVYSYYS
jgi:hypothetical protein